MLANWAGLKYDNKWYPLKFCLDTNIKNWYY
jgi:hypothetical protein